MTSYFLKISMLNLITILFILIIPLHTLDNKFKYRSYDEIVHLLYQLNETYPDLIELSIVQETYNLPYPSELICCYIEREKNNYCKQYLVRITNETSLNYPTDRPQVFFSGALHGDERIGPNAVIELILLLINHTKEFNYNLQKDNNGISQNLLKTDIQWIYYLINNRLIYFMPMTNAQGYFLNKRDENQIDTNRDYNYLVKGKDCMKSMTSRAVNEVFRDHLFQLAITFHAGMRAIAYEWGSPNHYLDNNGKSQKSPDHNGQKEICEYLAYFSGKYIDNTSYPTGTMNDIVYGVTGGMEDWAYGASWEDSFNNNNDKIFKPCEPETYGGYKKEKTLYNNATHRVINILVETSNKKHPDEIDLGSYEDLYSTDKLKNNLLMSFISNEKVGHITRNVRLGLMLIEAAEPYVNWLNHTYNEKNNSINFIWEALGGFTVDETFLEISNSSNFRFIIKRTKSQKGKTRWYRPKTTIAPTTIFRQMIQKPFLNNTLDTKLYVRAVLKMDQEWANQSQTGDDMPFPVVKPQTNYVNARTNVNWFVKNNKYFIRGKDFFYSKILVYNIKSKPIINSTVIMEDRNDNKVTNPIHNYNNTSQHRNETNPRNSTNYHNETNTTSGVGILVRHSNTNWSGYAIATSLGIFIGIILSSIGFILYNKKYKNQKKEITTNPSENVRLTEEIDDEIEENEKKSNV